MAKLILSKKPIAKELLKGPEGYLEMAMIAQTMNGDKTGFVGITHGTKGSKIVGGRLDLDLTKSTPEKYEDIMKGDISQYTS